MQRVYSFLVPTRLQKVQQIHLKSILLRVPTANLGLVLLGRMLIRIRGMVVTRLGRPFLGLDSRRIKEGGDGGNKPVVLVLRYRDNILSSSREGIFDRTI